jgi:DNA-binding MarR family transcriptional regulator
MNGSSGPENEQLFTHRTSFERGRRHALQSFVTDPLAIEANAITLRTGRAVRQATGLAKSVRAWRAHHRSEHLPSINDAQFRLLRDLYFATGQCLSMSELSEALGVTMTYITKLVEDLAAYGWVARVDDSADKRRTLAKLTGEGVATVEELLPGVTRQIERNWAVLTEDEKRLLVHLLAKVLSWVDDAEDTMVRPPGY